MSFIGVRASAENLSVPKFFMRLKKDMCVSVDWMDKDIRYHDVREKYTYVVIFTFNIGPKDSQFTTWERFELKGFRLW